MDKSIIIRPLEIEDFHCGYMELLSQLTEVGEVSFVDFQQAFKRVPNIFIMFDQESQKVVASATLLMEQKFIHQCSHVGHIEDVVVDSSQRGKGLGKELINYLMEKAKQAQCYKVILDCDQDKISFYQKCGLTEKGIEMAKYF